ncbi:n-acetylglutamate synthase [Peribacillus muralis]|uniref:n-acetylglutamate synthase n=2 Tax=Peribacillus muralis TaxID=264697 RepID=UPI0021484AAE|nr:n-acetylglutamate synthase [Peribacillus muralis]
MMINHDGRGFKGKSQTENGEASGSTSFHYAQEGSIISGSYQGGEIMKGTLRGLFNSATIISKKKRRQLFFHQEILTDGRIRLHEKWVGSEAEGYSIIEGQESQLNPI